MSTTMATTNPSRRALPANGCVVLHGLGWDEYVMINDAVPERTHARMVFVQGRLTILTTSRKHNWFADLLGDLVKAVTVGLEMECEPAGQATYRRADLKTGVEGDRTYYLGENAARMRGPVNVDLATQPPPDIAIEVEVCHSADDALLAWGRIGVPEVWRFDVEAWTFTFGQRQPDGSYQPSDRSSRLPGLTAADVLEQMRLAEELGWSRWNARIATWTRDVLRPRRGGGA